MIIGYVGTPGSGKSYDAIRRLIDNLKLGRKVCTNIEGFDSRECVEAQKALIGLDDYEYSQLVTIIQPHQVKEFWLHCPVGSFIVIDEVHNYFSNREWASAENKAFASWASTHRHHGYDVLLVTQDIEKVDKHVQSLIEWTYHYRKVNFFGSAVKNSYRVRAFAGSESKGKPLSTHTKQYDKKIFVCYKSYVGKDVKELGIMKHVNILRHPIFYALPVVLGFTLYMLFAKSSIATGDFLGSKKIQEAAVKAQKSWGTIASVYTPVKSAVFEFKDVPQVKPSNVLVSHSEPVSEAPMSCVVVADVSMDMDRITVEHCGDQEVKKKNGMVEYVKKKRGSKM